MAIVHLGEAYFIDDSPLAKEDWERKKGPGKRWGTPTIRAIDWYEGQSRADISIVPYAEFPSTERAYVGLALVKGMKEVLDSMQLGTDIEYSEPTARFWSVSDLPDRAGKYVFEEEPFVEVENKEDWKRLLETHAEAYDVEEPEKEYKYEGSGVYDGRDMSKAYESVLDYEVSYLEDEASNLTDYIFSGVAFGHGLKGDEWVEAFETLARRAAVDADVISQEEAEAEEGE